MPLSINVINKTMKSPFLTAIKKNMSKYTRSTLNSTLNRTYFQVPYAVIDREIPFNKYGLYLVAEVDKNEMNNTQFAMFKVRYIFFMSFFLIPNLTLFFSALTFIFIYYSKKLYNVNLDRGKLMIHKVFLDSRMKKVLLIYGEKNKVILADIVDLSLLNPEEFKKCNVSNGVYFKYHDNIFNFFLPYNMKVYDREIFSAIFRGCPLKIKESESNDINKFQKLIIRN